MWSLLNAGQVKKEKASHLDFYKKRLSRHYYFFVSFQLNAFFKLPSLREKYSGTLPYGHLVIMATFFGCLAKTATHVQVNIYFPQKVSAL